MFGLLYIHQKREDFSPSLFVASLQGSTPLLLILLTILSIFLLYSALTSRPSYLAWKGEEHLIQKTQTYNTPSVLSHQLDPLPIPGSLQFESQLPMKFFQQLLII